MTKTPIIVVLPNIRSAMNVGAIFRTADGINAEKIYLCGYTATPEHPKVTKTSLGAETTMDWEYRENSFELLGELKNKGYQIFGLELDDKATKIWDNDYNFPIVLVVGNEIHGIPKEEKELCDKIIYLPMLGKKKSLNVATSIGIACYELLRQFEVK